MPHEVRTDGRFDRLATENERPRQHTHEPHDVTAFDRHQRWHRRFMPGAREQHTRVMVRQRRVIGALAGPKHGTTQPHDSRDVIRGEGTHRC
jgi:hypothetical protein